jgi:hypothetical protein
MSTDQSDEMKTTTYYSECDCGQIVEGVGEYHPDEGTLYGQDCPACGEEFTVSGWFWRCDDCLECHPEGECE